MLIGGTLAVLTLVSWLAPVQAQALLQNFIQQLFQSAKLP
jgi:hypothetical protein